MTPVGVGRQMAANRRVLMVSSTGGHWLQMRRLEPAFADWHLHYACTDAGHRQSVPQPARFHSCPEASQWARLRLLWQLAVVAWVLLRVRPAVVVSTGASVGFFAVALGRLFGARTIWLDSIANVDELSLSGRMAGRFAHLWLTQWPQLARPGGPRYLGSVV
jgi:UDP-N-acetylglucosamine:LPS N-acetylglucosamine transferase